MILKKMLPGVLKELVKHVPTVLFKVVDWNELVSELPKISRRVLQKEDYERMFQHQQSFLRPFQIKLTPEAMKGNSHQVTKWSGERLLELYFAQLFSPEGLFIDLRSIHFHCDRPWLCWHPTGLWTKFSDEFRQGLLEVYEGFYLEDEDKYHSGLRSIGMLNDKWSDQDKKRLSDLFKAQFGSALTSEMNFDLDHFRSAILRMSEFMLKKEVNISKDFLYLGIYLVTLYDHLEEGHLKYPVKDIYLKVRNQFQSNVGPR